MTTKEKIEEIARLLNIEVDEVFTIPKNGALKTKKYSYIFFFTRVELQYNYSGNLEEEADRIEENEKGILYALL